MKYLLALSFLWLTSQSATADVGDVYFCSTIKHTEIAADGEVTNYAPTTFKFKVEEDEVKFGKTHVIDSSLPYKINHLLIPDKTLPKNWLDFEFRAETRFSRVEFHYEKKLHFTTSYPNGIRAFIADCEVFK